MPVKQEISDSIQISIEVKYIKHVPGNANLDEAVTRYPTRDELRDDVQRLLRVVRDKRTEQKEAVFGSIESKLESILANIEKLKQFYVTKEAEKFLKDLSEGEKHVQKCFSDPEISCWCIETSKPKFLTEELQRFDNCLESFYRILVNILQAEARETLKKAGTRDNNSVKNPEEVRKNLEKVPSAPGKDVFQIPTLSAPAESRSSDSNLQKARESLEKAQFETRDSNVNIPEKSRKSPEELVKAPGNGVSSTRTLSAEPAPCGSGSGYSNLHQEQQKPVLMRSSAFSKIEGSNPSENSVSTNTLTPVSGSGYTTTLTPTSASGYTTILTPMSAPGYTATLTPLSVPDYTTTLTPVSSPDYTTALNTFVSDKPLNRPARSTTSMRIEEGKGPG